MNLSFFYLGTQKSKQKPHESFIARQFNRVRHTLSHTPPITSDTVEEETNNEQQVTEESSIEYISIQQQQQNLSTATTTNCGNSGRSILTSSMTLSHTLEVDTRISSSRCLQKSLPLRHGNMHYGGEQLHEHLVSVTRNGECGSMRNNKGNTNGRTYKCPVHNHHHGCNKNRTLNNRHEHGANRSGTKSEESCVMMSRRPEFPRNDVISRNIPNSTEQSRYFEQRRYSCPIETIVYLEGSGENDMMSSKSIPKDLGKV